MTLIQTPNPDASLAAVLYLAQSIPVPTLHKVCALLYLADLHHLREFGSQMFGEVYRAMPDGPLAETACSEVLGLLGASSKELTYPNLAGQMIPPVEPDERYLSLFTRECLDWAVERYSCHREDALRQVVCNEPYQRILEQHARNAAPLISYAQLARIALGDEADLALGPFPSEDLLEGELS